MFKIITKKKMKEIAVALCANCIIVDDIIATDDIRRKMIYQRKFIDNTVNIVTQLQGDVGAAGFCMAMKDYYAQK